MFEADLTEKLQTIFGFKNVSFDLPAETVEQEKLFVAIETCRSHVKDAIIKAKVTGKIHVHVNREKMPYGYFAKRIAEAPGEITSDFFFYDIEENTGRYLNIAERSASFVFFFSTQYNPEVGTMTSINFEQVTE